VIVIGNQSDSFRHCVAACKIQKECGGLIPSLIGNIGNEFLDLWYRSGVAELRDILNGLWGSICSQPGRPTPYERPSSCCTYKKIVLDVAIVLKRKDWSFE
jgi:hypothetical protein